MARVLPLSTPPAEEVLREAERVVRGGGVIAVPTESFYAFGAGYNRPRAIERVRLLKGRPDGKPLLLLVADRCQMESLVSDIPSMASVLMDAFWPGPLTLIMSASSHLSAGLTSGSGTIGIRQPGHALLRDLLHQTGPLTGTSANRSGEAPLDNAAQVQTEFGADIDLILDGGRTPGGPVSTLVDIRYKPYLLREGGIARRHLEDVLNRVGLSLGD